MSGYDYVLTASTTHVILGSPKKLRLEILAELDRLKAEPFAEPDLAELGASGRKYSIRVRKRIIVTYWVDHAVKEIRVIRVEIC